MELADTPTRLMRLDEDTQHRLMNWGYAICDAEVRKHYMPHLPAPTAFPFPGGVG